MSDNGIIKALECQLLIDDSCNCYGCLYHEDKSCINASERILEVVKDLINHQKAEITDLKAKNEICAEVIARQDKEIENLTKSVDNYESCLRSVEVIRANAIKEFADRIGKLLGRYAHLHKYADEARKSTEEYLDGTPMEMVSVWEVLSLEKWEMVEYETMNQLQENIETIAKERLLSELEKDFRLLVKEMTEEQNAEENSI